MKLAISEKVKFALLLVVLCAILPLRRLDAFTNPQFWAEDIVFLMQAQIMGASSFLEPHAGYLHALPRTIAYIGSFLDPCLQPPVYVGLSVTLLLIVAGTALSPRLDLPFKPWLAAAVVIVPHTGEVFFNPTNVQWIAALALLLTVLKRDPEKTSDWIVDGLLLLFAGLSGPFILIALPLFAVRALVRRNAASLVLTIAAGLLGGIQLWFVLHSPPDTEFSGPFSAHGLLANLTFRLPFGLFFGRVAELTAPMGAWISISIGALLFLFLGYAIARAPRWRGSLITICAFALAVVALTALRKRIDVWEFGNLYNGDRYWYIPKVAFLWLAGILYAAHDKRAIKAAALALVCFALALNYSRFVFEPYKDFEWYDKCAEIRRGATVDVTINPGFTVPYSRPAKRP